MTHIDIMLDLETWGTKPGCDIRSIGATLFVPETGQIGKYRRDAEWCPGHIYDEGSFYIAVDNPQEADVSGGDYGSFRMRFKYPLHRDPETVKWWNDQSAEAQAAFADPVDLANGLNRFSSWVINQYPAPWEGKLTPDIRIWAHGPQFDCSILAAAYDACGLPVPWHYRAPRDTRTAFDLAGIDDHSGFMGMFNTGTHHHALDDAICQAKAVCAAFRVIRGLPVTERNEP